MRKVVSEFVKTPFYANIIIAVILVGGIFAYTQMSKSFFPNMTSRHIMVTVMYPGASPKEMEEGITSRIEEACRGLVGIKEITSTSSENMATVTIETTGEYDIDETMMEVKNNVDGISSLPVDAERPIVFKRRAMSMAAFVALEGDVDNLTLKSYYNKIEADLLSSGVVSQITPMGAVAPEISVEINEEELLRYNLTLSDISTAIRMNNSDISGGLIKNPDEEFVIRLRSRSSDTEKIGNIIIRGADNGSYIRIRDVATVKKQQPLEFYPTYNKGKKVITLMVNKLPEEDLEDIHNYITNYIEEFNAKNQGVTLEMSFSFLEMLNDRLDMLVKNGMIGLVLVLITLTLFLNIRLSAWVAWGIPSAFLATFIVASIIGVTINMMSLFGFLLVLGILVDDGIVIGENIFAHFEKGKSPMRSAVDGTMEVVPAVTTSILTTVLAFTPFLLITGMMEMMRDVGVIVILTLIFSLIEAFFVLPGHIGNHGVLRRKTNDQKFFLRRVMDQFMNWLRLSVYDKIMRHILKWRYIYFFVPVFLILVTVGLLNGGFIRTTIFPNMAPDMFNVNVAFVPGSGETKTREYLDKFETKLEELDKQLQEEFNDDVTFIDGVYSSVGSAFSGQEVGSHAGNLMIFPRNSEEMPDGFSSLQMQAKLRALIGDVPEAELFNIQGENRFGKPVSISLLSSNLTELDSAKAFLKNEMAKMPVLKDVKDNNAQGKIEVRIKLKPKAYFLGLTEQTVVGQIRRAFYGDQAQRLQEGRNEYRIWVRYPEENRERLGQLERMKIKTPMGNFPLSEICDYTYERGPVQIKRFNGQRESRVEADLTDPYASVTDILEDINKNIMPVLKERYPGVRTQAQGQAKEGKEFAVQMGTYFGIAFILMVVILMIHFRSAQQPLIILMVIPLSILGGLWGHGIHGVQVSMLSFIGMIALTGVIINDSVVFLSRYNQLLESGMKVYEAIIEAGKSRLRPIILTTVTTSAGLFPLIFERSFQAQFLIPMAISLAYGVAVGTLFILLFFPLLIHILSDIRTGFGRLWHSNKELAREDVEFAVKHKRRVIE
jgi:multidrug efflux pump subunit AcrB